MNGNIFPNLVKVFYTNITFEGRKMSSHVKGVDMEITLTGLKYSREKVDKGNTNALEDFNKMQYYIATWMLRPRGVNHVVLTEQYLVLLYWIMKKIKVNGIYVFKEHMLKSIRLCDYHFPYVILL